MKLIKRKKKDPDYFNMLSAQCSITYSSITELIRYIDTGDSSLCDKIELLEKEADQIRRDLIKGTESSFITPIDRHDIFAVSRCIDDLTDKIKDIKDLLVFFEIVDLNPPIREMLILLKDSLRHLTVAVSKWDSKDKDTEDFWDSLIKAKKNENFVKRKYWELVDALDYDQLSIKEILKIRELAKDINGLGNKIGKAADRIGDIRMKEL